MTKPRLTAVLVLGVATLAAFHSRAETQNPSAVAESFSALEPVTETVFLLANSSIIIGADPNGPSDEITFTGTVNIRKFPHEGFERRKLDNGRYEIDFELLNSELRGESYVLGGMVKLGEDKELPSLGVITQTTSGKDFPANFIVQRKVLIETPAGVFKNVDPVPVRGVIDSIPPFRLATTPQTLNVFKGEQLPVAMLDSTGNVGGWFYSKMHLAFAVDPAEIYRMNVAGEISIRGKDRSETVKVEGPIEFIRNIDRNEVECVKLALRGESELFGGRVMLTESFGDSDKFSKGTVGLKSSATSARNSFPLYVDVKTPAGTMLLPAPIPIEGTVKSQRQIDTVQMRGRTVPVYALETEQEYSASGSFAVTNEAEQPVGLSITSIRFHTVPDNAGAQRRPCCPRK
jgi:hypothetical protein